MVIAVDELDINSVVLDQEVNVTLDAFPAESYTAKIAHISKLGKASGNITTYSVELSLEYNERLLEGMNGNAVIMVERAENVLFIPIAAIYEDSTGTYVYIVNGKTQKRVDITTGISDGVNAEVTSGLSVNDVVQYIDTSSSSAEVTYGMGGRNFFGGGGGQ
jgi:Membrane-fusion protein